MQSGIKMIYKIAIIGSGASGTAVFVNIIDKIRGHAIKQPVNIYLIEKNTSQFAKGVAYNTSYGCNLINTPADTMGIVADNKKDFLLWLEENQIRSKASPSYTSSTYPYLPRSVFGKYLCDKMEKAIKAAQNKGVKVNIINDEVIDVEEKYGKYKLLFASKGNLLVDRAILSIGGYIKSPYKNIVNKPGYYDSPYQSSRDLNAIPSEKTIGILGSRLSAIDAALMLRDNNHKGKIYLVSRQGLLPTVHGKYIPGKNSHYLTKRNIDLLATRKGNDLKLNQFLNLVKKEVYKCEGKEINCSQLLSFHSRIEAWLRAEISKADNKVRNWQSALFSTNDLVNKIWGLFSIKDKKKFLDYIPIFMVYRAAMPITAAKSIYSLIRNKKLSIFSGVDNITYNEESASFDIYLSKDNEPKVLSVDCIVNATGVCNEFSEDTQHPLLKNLLGRGVIRPNDFMGIDMYHNNINPIAKNGRVLKDFFIIGGATKGNELVSNLLEFIVEKAIKISDNIAANLKTK